MGGKRKSKFWPILAITLLALVCIGAVELAVCRVADPALYQRLTAPARAFFSAAGDRVAQAADDIAQAADDIAQRLTPPATEAPEVEPEPQLAGDPELSTDTVADPTITRLDDRADGAWLMGGTLDIRYFCQSAPEWADKAYGTDTIGPYGCGPTAMAMAIASMTEETVDPVSMAAWAYGQGHWSKGHGSRLSLIRDAGGAFGLTVRTPDALTTDTLLRELSTGHVAVALMTKGHFTKGGHFILLRGATLDGRILVADPNSPERSLITWDPQLILDELSPSRHDGAPLWFLSVE